MEKIKIKKSDVLHIPPSMIEIEEGFNTRKDFDLDGLVQSIKEFGVKQPMTCYKVKGEERYIIIDGERRLRAVQTLARMGVEIVRVPVIPMNKPAQDERMFLLLVKNDGKNLTHLELAATYKRLIDYGHTITEIATKIGRQYTHVSDMLKLLEMPIEVQNAIREGRTTANQALGLLDDVGVEAVVKHVRKVKPGEKLKVIRKLPLYVVSRKEIEKLGYDSSSLSNEEFTRILSYMRDQHPNFDDTLLKALKVFKIPKKK